MSSFRNVDKGEGIGAACSVHPEGEPVWVGSGLNEKGLGPVSAISAEIKNTPGIGVVVDRKLHPIRKRKLADDSAHCRVEGDLSGLVESSPP